MADIDRYRTAIPVYLIDGNTGLPVSFASGGAQTTMGSADLDTGGDKVPTYKAHSYTYDNSGNLATDTVTDGGTSWVRTYQWSNGALSSDSGWVKQ